MAELQLTYEELRRHISRFIGVGRTESDYSGDSARLADVNDSMYSGLRDFYWTAGHQWSFLEEERTLSLDVGVHTYELPAAFSRLTEYFTYPDDSNKRPIAVIPAHHLRAMRATENKSGDPVYCAIQTAGTANGDATLSEVVFYPKPSSVAVLTYRMEVEPFVASSAFSSSLLPGGAMHSETIVEACLAAAERDLNPEAGPGIHAEKYQQLLAKSIQLDKEQSGETHEADSWPLDGITAGVTSLDVTKSQLERLIGRALFSNPNPQTWTHGQAVSAAEVLRNGLRKFYQPMVLPGERDAHQWSFLTPVSYIDLEASKGEYDLPQDFALIRGQITYAPDTSIMYPPITLVSEEQVRWYRQSTGTSGRPYMAAVRAKHSNDKTGTHYELILAPLPSESRQIAVPYSINPEQLGGDQTLPMGGQPHAQTIIEACLAAAEIQLKSGNTHQQEFMTCLQTSISHDRMLSAPHTLGYNGDYSDGYYDDYAGFGRHNNSDLVVTYNGSAYWD